ncbi:S-adenosyl-L-methionine-dependent methyltransferase [Schizopora paradoxa]|uniref:S-adenosyl-L-methionine-dependent methyltransferase n=1 Tax=Schizopora paradoxa TaxID=27342 RepID=A0A0H2S2Z9_9AGAM|nr:S-adenosyl-L-methionine-dependent methyltransferase [Schizopora paradoxa]
MDIDIDFDDDARSDSGMTAVSSTSQSPAPSMYSFTSSRDGRTLYREIAGRKLNAQNDLYQLPSDDNEHNRLDKQHLVHLLSVGRLYTAVEEIEEVLADNAPYQKAVLDLGCGGGNWASAMALEFPHAQIVGVDLAPTTSRPPPPNCRFEFDDFTLGMQHYYNSFDVVHSRAVANGVKDFEWLIHEAAKCLRPGGVLYFIEGNMELRNSFREPAEVAFGQGGPGQSWMARMCFEAYNTMKSRGSALDAGVMLERWMNAEPEITDVKYDVKWIPIGPWDRGVTPEETRQLIHLGTLMRQNMKEYARSLVPLFLANGFAPDLVSRFIEGADKELDDLSVHLYLTYHHCWGRKVGSPNVSAAQSAISSMIGSPRTDASSDVDVDDNDSVRAASDVSARSMLSPGPNAIPVVWEGQSPYTSTAPVRFDAESVYSGSLGSVSMSISDDVPS